MQDWEASNLDNSEYLGTIEIPTNLEETEWQLFELVVTPTKIVFGGACNVGFLESGYLLRSTYRTLDEDLQMLYEELRTYYQDGPRFTTSIVCNKRM
jgi:hypothetical protein